VTEIEFPLDDDGYLDRQCPSCERHFRWHNGPVEGSVLSGPEPDAYFCPYCGFNAPVDQWWTTEQVEAIQQAVIGAAHAEIERSLGDAFKGSKYVKFQPAGVRMPPPAPVQLDEIDDLLAVASHCHPYEPVKIDIRWTQPVHCLVCGSRFVLPK